MSDSLRPHGLQHDSLPCPFLSPEVCSNLCPLSHWLHPIISSFVALFSSCPQSFPASGSFPMSQLFISGGQSIGTSASASILPVNIQGLFPLELTGLISLLSRWLSSVFSSTTIQKHHFFGVLPSLLSNSHIHTWLLENPQLWLMWSLLFNTLSKFVIAFFPRSKHLLISWLKSLSAVILEPKKIKSATVSTVCSSICYEVMV